MDDPTRDPRKRHDRPPIVIDGIKRDPWTGVPFREDDEVVSPLDFTTIDLDQLHTAGRQEYGEAWMDTGLWMSVHAGELRKAGELAFAMAMIHHKISRALTTPTKRDHYDDIIGYANLILSELERTKKGGQP